MEKRKKILITTYNNIKLWPVSCISIHVINLCKLSQFLDTLPLVGYKTAAPIVDVLDYEIFRNTHNGNKKGYCFNLSDPKHD